MCTCINCNIDHYISLHAWLQIANKKGQRHGHNVLLHFKLVGCAHAHSYNLYCALGLLQGSSLKKVGFWGYFYQGDVSKGRVKG